ncbi:hypothetical protein HDU96_008712 [Phlyctochytrium bullatum]|nr:hypothetical protein HDU96_008712 [Phlyctochytrium bullatum]
MDSIPSSTERDAARTNSQCLKQQQGAGVENPEWVLNFLNCQETSWAFAARGSAIQASAAAELPLTPAFPTNGTAESSSNWTSSFSALGHLTGVAVTEHRGPILPNSTSSPPFSLSISSQPSSTTSSPSSDIILTSAGSQAQNLIISPESAFATSPLTAIIGMAAGPSAVPSTTRGTGPRLRSLRACDLCSTRKLRCIMHPGDKTCTRCLSLGLACRFTKREARDREIQEARLVEAVNTSVEMARWAAERAGEKGNSGRPTGCSGTTRLCPRSQEALSDDDNFDLFTGQQILARHASGQETQGSTANRIPRLLTPFDDLPPLPPQSLQTLLLRLSFREPFALAPVFHPATLPTRDIPEFLQLALSAAAARFNGDLAAEGKVMFERAKRWVVPMLCGEVASGESQNDSWEQRIRALELLQAATFLMIYCFMDGRKQWVANAFRWFSMVIVCAREAGLNVEVDEGDMVYKETRRRWILFLKDSVYSVANNTPPICSEEEASHLRIFGYDTCWLTNRPFDEGDLPYWYEVLDTLDNANDQDTPEIMRYIWARNLTMGVLRRRANDASNALWESIPSMEHPNLVKLTKSMEMWLRCFNQFHTVGDGTASSGGKYCALRFIKIFYHGCYLLMHAPRPEIDGWAQSPFPHPLSPMLEAWLVSPHAEVCKRHLLALKVFWQTVLDGKMVPEDTADQLGTFYDKQVCFLGMLGWDAMYAARLAALMELHETRSAVNKGKSVGCAERWKSCFEVFMQVMDGMATIWRAVGRMKTRTEQLRNRVRVDVE